MKLKIIALLVIQLTASYAYAGVKDKKAIRGADEVLIENAAKTQAACGNAVLEISSDWASFETMIESNASVLADKKYQTQWIYSQAGERNAAVLEAFAKVCTEDADYKEEIANLSQVIFVSKADFSDTWSDLSLEDNTLTVNVGHYMTRRSDDYISKIKALY